MVGTTLITGSIQLCGATTGIPKGPSRPLSRAISLTRHGQCPDGVAHAMQLLASRRTGMQGHFSLLDWVDRTLNSQVRHRIIVLCGL